MKQFYLNKWILLSISTASILCSCGGGDSDAEEMDDYATDNSIAVTGSSSEITPVSAEIVCNANIEQGGSASFELGVMYSTDSEELKDFKGSKASTKNLVGNAYKVTLSFLQPNTTYYYRSYVTFGGINNYGKIKSFTTQSVASPSTLQAETITASSVYLYAKRGITKEYANEIGFSFSDGIVISDKTDSIEYHGWYIPADYYESSQNDNYRVKAYGLQPGTVYYYKAYTKINGSYTYGSIKNFTTSDFDKPSVSVSNPTDITCTSASAIVITNDLSNYNVNSIGVVYYAADATILGSSYKTANSNTLSGTQHPVTLSDLYLNTTYYMKPFVSIKIDNHTQEVYGEIVAFKTAQRIYIYGDVAANPDQLPFQPGAWDAAAMRFSSTEGAHLPTIPDNVYFGLKTLIFDVSDVTADFDLKVMNGWWSNTYYDHVKWKNGLNELQITETMAKECAMGGEGRDLDLMLYSGSMILHSVYYEE